MAGRMWSSAPLRHSEWFDNDHFRMWLQLRLGVVSAPSGAVCQIKRNDGDPCLHAITNPCVHPHICSKGPARLRPHKAVMVAMEQVCKRGGAGVDLERAIPALYRVASDGKVTEAILDVVVLSPGSFNSFSVDVTIRCPHSIRNERQNHLSANRAAVAACDGELEKLMRYGEEVSPLSLETYGRIGVKSLQCMRQLTTCVATSSSHYCSYSSGSHMLRALLIAVERALAYNIADVTLLSLGHSAGLHALRCRAASRSSPVPEDRS